MGFNVDVTCGSPCIEIILTTSGVPSSLGPWVDSGPLTDVDCEDGILWCAGRPRIDIPES